MNTIITIWFIIIGLMVVAGIVFRLVPRTLPPVQLHKVAPRAAVGLVSDFIISSYDSDFGYPSGLFLIERSSDTEIAAREFVAKGSHFMQILRGFYVVIFSIAGEMGCIGAVIALIIACFATPVLLYAALAETLLKYLLRSRINGKLERSGDGTQVTFWLRGPVAMLVGRRLERAFLEPALPPRIASLAGLTAVPATAIAPVGGTR